MLHFLRYLADNDVPVGIPIPSARGNFIELLDGGDFPAAQQEAPGQVMTRHMLDFSGYETWGRSQGKLHAASRSYQPDPAIDYGFSTVQQFWKNIESTVLEPSPELRWIYADLTACMRNLPPRDYGLIHGDYRPGNVIWGGGSA